MIGKSNTARLPTIKELAKSLLEHGMNPEDVREVFEENSIKISQETKEFLDSIESGEQQ